MAQVEVEVEVEPEPEPEPAAAEAVPVLPLARRTLATSNFRAAYGSAEVPGVLEVGMILSELIRGYCRKENIPWKEEGQPFFKRLQAEAMANAQELVSFCLLVAFGWFSRHFRSLFDLTSS